METCGWRVGPVPKLDGEVVVCVKPPHLPDDPTHEDGKGAWFENCGRAPGTPHHSELETRKEEAA